MGGHCPPQLIWHDRDCSEQRTEWRDCRKNRVINVTALAIFFAIVLAINLMPAFGPPTWSIIVLYGLNTDLPLMPIILVGAAAAASGRFLLAKGFRQLGNLVSKKTRSNLAAARTLFQRNQRNSYVALGLFAVSPLPSAQLFEAAGLAKVPLARFTIAFFLGRMASYSVYALSANKLKQSSLGAIFADSLSNPIVIAIELLMLGALIGLTRIDWQRHLSREETQG
jgi:uncharacterized membrane protein YdjX (TVP38/TMEM64 family)